MHKEMFIPPHNTRCGLPPVQTLTSLCLRVEQGKRVAAQPLWAAIPRQFFACQSTSRLQQHNSQSSQRDPKLLEAHNAICTPCRQLCRLQRKFGRQHRRRCARDARGRGLSAEVFPGGEQGWTAFLATLVCDIVRRFTECTEVCESCACDGSKCPGEMALQDATMPEIPFRLTAAALAPNPLTRLQHSSLDIAVCIIPRVERYQIQV